MKRDRIVHLFATLTAVLLLTAGWRWSEIRPGAGRSAEAIAAERAARADTSHDSALRHATGRLGHPIGKPFVIEGQVVSTDRKGHVLKRGPGGNFFEVTVVDGKQLPMPAYIWVEDLERLEGGRLRLEGYEYERWLGYEGSAIVQGFYPLFVPLKITRLK